MAVSESSPVIVYPPTPTPRPRREASPRPPRWRRRWVLAALILVLVLVVGAAVVAARLGASGPPPSATSPATPASARLVAHGQIVPARQARVGTQGGGVVRRLQTSVGSQVAEQTALAVVVGPSGTEVLTAPFSGTVTNVLVHEGDTVLPGNVIAIVADLSTLQVETSDVDQFLVVHVRVGQPVDVRVDALDNVTLKGTVREVALLPQTDASGNQAYPVTISLIAPPAHEVRAGMSVRITLPE